MKEGYRKRSLGIFRFNFKTEHENKTDAQMKAGILLFRDIFFDIDKKPFSLGLTKVISTLSVYFCLKIMEHLLHFSKQSSFLKM